MSITVNKSDGTVLAQVDDQTVNANACSLPLVGIGGPNYAEIFAENFVHLLENFASNTPPANPLAGQLWFERQTRTLSAFDGQGWVEIIMAANGATSTATVELTPTNYATVLISDSKIIAAISDRTWVYEELPATINLGSQVYQVKSRFPNGIKGGIHLAVDGSNTYRFSGPVDFALSSNSATYATHALSADQADTANTAQNASTAVSAQFAGLANSINARNVLVNGDVTGSSVFDGMSDLTLPLSLNTTGVIAGSYTKVTVDLKGRVTSGAQVTKTELLDILGDVSGIPVGGIIMWSGTAIPSGWALCDGGVYQKSDASGPIQTPDLRSRFVIGAGAVYNVGDTGGSTTALGTTSAAGAHDHSGSTASVAGSHTHTGGTASAGAHDHGGAAGATALTVDQLPPHTHTYQRMDNVANGGAGTGQNGVTYSTQNTSSTGNGATHSHTITADGGHVHTMNLDPAGDHTHALNITAASDHTHNISVTALPPYYALAFIMKV